MDGYDPKVTPWSVKEDDFPCIPGWDARLRFLLQYAILAPSTRNTQPWRFKIDGDQVKVYADLDRWQHVVDGEKRELHISIGCAIENFLLAAAHFGVDCRVSYFPEAGFADPVASIECSTGTAAGDQAIFRAITSRRTNHKEYSETPLAPGDLAAIRDVECEPGIHVWITDERGAKRKVDEMVGQADRILFDLPAYREELSVWISEGVFGTPWLVSMLGSWAVSNLKLGSFRASRDTDLLWSAPSFGVICSESDDAVSHVRTGRVFQRICLAAESHGVSVHPFSQIVEVDETRVKLAELIPASRVYPQQPFRLGYADPEPHHTPRRPLEESLI